MKSQFEGGPLIAHDGKYKSYDLLAMPNIEISNIKYRS